jgi:hypothetical protein
LGIFQDLGFLEQEEIPPPLKSTHPREGRLVQQHLAPLRRIARDACCGHQAASVHVPAAGIFVCNAMG